MRDLAKVTKRSHPSNAVKEEMVRFGNRLNVGSEGKKE